MNERMLELAKQAEWLANRGDNVDTVVMMGKFGELIILDCMDVALDRKKWVEDQVVFDPRDHAWNKARVQQSQHIVDKIKEHFGVEE